MEINNFSPLHLKKMELKQFGIARLKENPLTIQVESTTPHCHKRTTSVCVNAFYELIFMDVNGIFPKTIKYNRNQNFHLILCYFNHVSKVKQRLGIERYLYFCHIKTLF